MKLTNLEHLKIKRYSNYYATAKIIFGAFNVIRRDQVICYGVEEQVLLLPLIYFSDEHIWSFSLGSKSFSCLYWVPLGNDRL